MTWIQRHIRALDAAFFAVLAAVLMLPLPGRASWWVTSTAGVQLLLVAVFVGPLLLRWRTPRAVFVLLVVATLAAWPVDGLFLGRATLPFAGYAMTVSLERPAATRATAAGLLVLLLPALWTVPDGDLGAVVGLVVSTALGCTLGMAAASQRKYFHEASERVRVAEQSREEEAARRVVEERLRISRELHDVIAHHIAVINVQSGLAEHLLRSDPDTAAKALVNVREAARTVLEELGGVLAVMRQESGVDHPRTPTPGLAQVGALVQATESQGHRVSLQIDGEPQSILAGVELTAYRVVQEALTNVHKHAPGAAVAVHLGWGPRTLTVCVVNTAAEPSAPRPVKGNGFGLIGMRERVTAIGGTLTAEALPTEAWVGGTFRVRAVLPLDRTRP